MLTNIDYKNVHIIIIIFHTQVRFQHNLPFETPSRFGTAPQWNEKLQLNVQTSNGKFDQDSLTAVEDDIRIILWDEIEIGGDTDRCYLGHIDVPFQALFQRGKISGNLALVMPPKFRDNKMDRSTCIGYRNQGYRIAEEDGKFVEYPTMLYVVQQIQTCCYHNDASEFVHQNFDSLLALTFIILSF